MGRAIATEDNLTPEALLEQGRLMAKPEEVWTQLATRIPKDLHRRLKLYCVTNDIALMHSARASSTGAPRSGSGRPRARPGRRRVHSAARARGPGDAARELAARLHAQHAIPGEPSAAVPAPGGPGAAGARESAAEHPARLGLERRAKPVCRPWPPTWRSGRRRPARSANAGHP